VGQGSSKAAGDNVKCGRVKATLSSRARVFAIGDVRAGSIKRVAAAVGEGVAVVTQIHSVLAIA
jgi:thioredoxin reductase (NADPH)